MIHVVVSRMKRRIFEEYLSDWGASIAHRVRIVDYETLFTLGELPRGTWVLADFDALGPAGDRVVAGARDALARAGLRVLNDPRRTLRRFDLLTELHRRGVNDFRVARADDEGMWRGFRYPVFVRGARDHLGAMSDLLRTPDEVREAVDELAGATALPDDLIVVEFEDTADADGLYVKHGTYVVGDRILPQHVLRSRTWMIKHRQSFFDETTQTEENRLVVANPWADPLREIAEVAGVEYGRIDFSVRPGDGRIQVWEINLCPIIGRNRQAGSHHSPVPDALRELRNVRREHSYRLLAEAWEALDPGAEEGPPVPFEVDDELRATAAGEMVPAEGGRGLMRIMRGKAHFRRW